MPTEKLCHRFLIDIERVERKVPAIKLIFGSVLGVASSRPLIGQRPLGCVGCPFSRGRLRFAVSMASASVQFRRVSGLCDCGATSAFRVFKRGRNISTFIHFPLPIAAPQF